MSTSRKIPTGNPRERILQVASDLFYRQGYRATGINEVIEKSGVAKATFYNHFPTKDDLALAYLENTAEHEISRLGGMLDSTEGALNRFFVPLNWLKVWLEETDFRGCAFLHAVAENPDPESPLRTQGKRLYDTVRGCVGGLAGDLIESNKKKYGHLDQEALTNAYWGAFAGAIALSEIYHADWPVEHALQTLRGLIGE